MVLSKTCFVTLLHTIHKLTFRTKHIEIEITIKETKMKVKERKQIRNIIYDCNMFFVYVQFYIYLFTGDIARIRNMKNEEIKN